VANDSYLGGHTLIGPHTPWWFSYVDEPLWHDEAFRQALARLERLLGEAAAGKKGRHFRRKLAEAKRAVDAFRPTIAVPKKPLTQEAQDRITELKRQLAAFTKQAQSAAAQHEELRQELIGLLDEFGLPPDQYPETNKLSL